MVVSWSRESTKKKAEMSAVHAPQGSPGLRICMLAYTFYESDPRVLQYARSLAQRGDTVHVIALKRDDLPECEVSDGVTVYRIQSRLVNEKGLLTYATRLMRFLLRSTVFLHRKHREQPYDIVHVHNVPDFLVFAAASLKWRGVPIILDIHDLLPELYASKFRISHASLVFQLLVIVERWAAAFATHVIIANHLWHDRLVARSSRKEKCSVVRNYPALESFVEETGQERKKSELFLLTYPGSLNWHQGLDVAIRAFASIADQAPEAEFHIYGEGPAKASLIQLANELGLRERVIFHEFLPSRQIARVMAATDLAIEPKRATSAFGNEALSTKILEFMALGVPVIASKTKSHTYYYDDNIIQYYENDDAYQLADQIIRLKSDPDLRWRLIANAKLYVREHNWDVRKHEYLQLVDSLAGCGVRRDKPAWSSEWKSHTGKV
jgi:glycosyltransferase involved in cell wall biosynthesis